MISDNFPGIDNIIPTFFKSFLVVFFFCRPYNTLRDPFVFIIMNAKICRPIFCVFQLQIIFLFNRRFHAISKPRFLILSEFFHRKTFFHI